MNILGRRVPGSKGRRRRQKNGNERSTQPADQRRKAHRPQCNRQGGRAMVVAGFENEHVQRRGRQNDMHMGIGLRGRGIILKPIVIGLRSRRPDVANSIDSPKRRRKPIQEFYRSPVCAAEPSPHAEVYSHLGPCPQVRPVPNAVPGNGLVGTIRPVPKPALGIARTS